MRDGYEIKKIGIINDLIFPYEIYKKLEMVFPCIDKVSVETLMYDMRMRKSENELACIKKACEIITDSFAYAVEHLKPGTTSRELYMLYSNFLEKKGYKEYSPYGSVHSIGMLECESPWFSVSRDVEMVDNMVVAIDTYFKGLPWGSFRIEDTFIIRKEGAEITTKFNKGFIPEMYK